MPTSSQMNSAFATGMESGLDSERRHVRFFLGQASEQGAVATWFIRISVTASAPGRYRSPFRNNHQ